MTNSPAKSRIEQVLILLALALLVVTVGSALLLAITDLWVTILILVQ